MSAADRPEQATTGDLAAGLRDAGFVRLVAAPDGDSVAAAGLLAGSLTASGHPYQLSVTPHTERTERSTDADITVAVGRSARGADLTLGLDGASTPTANAVATEFGYDELALALAGAVAADGHPGDELATDAAEHGIERRPGIGIPTTDTADGLAHATLLHGPFSGNREQAATALADSEDGRALASEVALAVAGDPEGTAHGATCVERFLRPLAGGPFETIEGYADVLDVLAREQPGLAVALALGGGDHEAALDVWRAHATEAHEAVRQARTGRYNGLFVAQCDGQPPVGTVARLVAEFRSPEPLAVVVGDGVAAARAVGQTETDVGETVAATAQVVDGSGGGTATAGHARFDGDPTEFVAAFTEAV